MDDNIAQQVIDLLEKLGRGLSDIAPSIIDATIKAHVINGAAWLVVVFIGMLVGLFFVYRGFKQYKKDMEHKYREISDVAFYSLLFGSVTTALFFGTFMIALVEVLKWMLAPEYMLLSTLLEMLGIS